LFIFVAVVLLCFIMGARRQLVRFEMKVKLQKQIAERRALLKNLEKLKAKADRRNNKHKNRTKNT
jgi:predicted nuclease with TOPRIM domain